MLHLYATTLKAFAKHGWFKPEKWLNGDSPRKSFPTAVGRKDASVRVYMSSESPMLILQGEYFSEGGNVLATDFLWIKASSTCAEVEALVAKWVAAAEKSIGSSYAARLLTTPPVLLGPVTV
jgi:hypothetical protein